MIRVVAAGLRPDRGRVAVLVDADLRGARRSVVRARDRRRAAERAVAAGGSARGSSPRARSARPTRTTPLGVDLPDEHLGAVAVAGGAMLAAPGPANRCGAVQAAPAAGAAAQHGERGGDEDGGSGGHGVQSAWSRVRSERASGSRRLRRLDCASCPELLSPQPLRRELPDLPAPRSAARGAALGRRSLAPRGALVARRRVARRRAARCACASSRRPPTTATATSSSPASRRPPTPSGSPPSSRSRPRASPSWPPIRRRCTREIGAEPDPEEALWLAFLTAYLVADRGRRPVRRRSARRTCRGRRGELPDLDVALGLRTSHEHVGGRAHGARLPRLGDARRQPGRRRSRARPRGRRSAASTGSSSGSRCRASAGRAATSCSCRSGASASSTCARRRCSSPTTRRRSPPSASSASATRCCSSAARATSPTRSSVPIEALDLALFNWAAPQRGRATMGSTAEASADDEPAIAAVLGV